MRPILFSWALLAACKPDPPSDPSDPSDPSIAGPEVTDSDSGTVTVPHAHPCSPVPDGDPWEVALQWSWDAGNLLVVRSPMVANLTDDDGDGQVTVADIPDVVAVAGGFLPHTDTREGPLLLLDGATGAVHEEGSRGYDDLDDEMAVSIADVTGDGTQEIVVRRARATRESSMVALDATFHEIWSVENGWSDSTPTVADLDNDGHAEVIDSGSVLDGRDGTIVATFDLPLPTFGSPITTADLDLDGRREILVGNQVVRADGTLWWSAFVGSPRVFPVAANVDADPEGEVLFLTTIDPPGPLDPPVQAVEVRDTDGTLLGVLELPHGGDPAMADLDGDGAPELIVSGSAATTSFRLDGTLLWTVTSNEVAGPAAGFDFDADGAYEVVVGHSTGFDILDGATGASRVRVSYETASTVFPVIADLDNDGAAEILVAGPEGIAVFENPSCLWPKGGVGWGIHDFTGVNLGDDGSVPTNDPPIWQGTGNYRARP